MTPQSFAIHVLAVFGVVEWHWLGLQIYQPGLACGSTITSQDYDDIPMDGDMCETMQWRYGHENEHTFYLVAMAWDIH